MGRAHSIRGKSVQPRVDALLDQGVSPREIARLMASDSSAPSASAVYRYARDRRSNLARAFDGEVGPVDVLVRLIDLADAARAARRAAVATGSTAALNRAVAVEAQVLGKLLTEFDVTSATITDLFAEVSGMTVALRTLATERPDAALALAAILAENSTTHDLARALHGALAAQEATS